MPDPDKLLSSRGSLEAWKTLTHTPPLPLGHPSQPQILQISIYVDLRLGLKLGAADSTKGEARNSYYYAILSRTVHESCITREPQSSLNQEAGDRDRGLRGAERRGAENLQPSLSGHST